MKQSKKYYLAYIITILILLLLNFYSQREKNALSIEKTLIAKKYEQFIANNISIKEMELDLFSRYRNRIAIVLFNQNCHQCIDSTVSALAQSSLDHNNIVILHDYQTEREMLSLLMKFNVEDIEIEYIPTQILLDHFPFRNLFLYVDQNSSFGPIFLSYPQFTEESIEFLNKFDRLL